MKKVTYNSFLALSILLMVFAIFQPAIVAQTYHIIDLGTFGGDITCPWRINDRGQIVGFSYTDSGERHAFFWENGVLTDLGTLSWDESVAHGIDNFGQVVGTIYICTAPSHCPLGPDTRQAFWWENGVMTELDGLDYAYAINDSGQVAGGSFIPSGDYHAFLWEGGIMTDLGTFCEGGATDAFDINENAQIVGWSYIEGRLQIFSRSNKLFVNIGEFSLV